MKYIDCRYMDYKQEPYIGIFLNCKLGGDVEESI